MLDMIGPLKTALNGIVLDEARQVSLDLAMGNVAMAQERISMLEKKAAESAQELADLRAELAARPDPARYTELRGVLWKLLPGGGHHQDPYCPSCKQALHPVPGDKSIMTTSLDQVGCSLCRFRAPFRHGETKSIKANADAHFSG